MRRDSNEEHLDPINYGRLSKSPTKKGMFHSRSKSVVNSGYIGGPGWNRDNGPMNGERINQEIDDLI